MRLIATLNLRRCQMIGGGAPNGHAFRASNDRNARAFIAEKKQFKRAPERLPKTRFGRIALLVVMAAVVLVVVLA